MNSPFANTRANRHQLAAEWRQRTGGRIVGVFCCDVPEELLYAAGMLPVRILADHEDPIEADLHFPVNVCPYPKCCFDLALRGGYDYLDGLIVPNTCDMIRAMYGFWSRGTRIPYVRFLEVPQRLSPTGVAFFATELGRFRASLEEWVGAPITDDALRDAIAVYNENRALLRRLYALKAADPPPVLASDVQDAVIASMLMPKAEHSAALRQLIAAAEASDPDARHGESSTDDRVRLFVSASMLDDSDFFRMVEDCGATVVADDMPMGSRYLYGDVVANADPLRALAERYLLKVACPRKMASAGRVAFVGEMLAGADVRGAIVHNLRACDCHLYEYPVLRQFFESQGLPVLFIKGEETEAELDQQRAEVEAFLEILQD